MSGQGKGSAPHGGASAGMGGCFGRRLETPFGLVRVFGSIRDGAAGIDLIVLPGSALPAGRGDTGAGSAVPPPLEALFLRLAATLRDGNTPFPPEALRLENCSAFQHQVLLAQSAVLRGFVTTYRFLAERVGRPLAVRAVGTALATNPFPLVIPCHRTVRSDGTLGGYAGGLAMKRALLEREGIAFAEGRGGTIRVEGRFIVRPPDD